MQVDIACFKNRLVSGQTNRAVRRGNHGLQGVRENCFPSNEDKIQGLQG